MTISRYKDLDIIVNEDVDYKKANPERYGNKDFLRHFETQDLEYPTFEEINRLSFANHLWAVEDRYYKLAQKYYGNPEYWWVIAWFNKKPTEQHVKIGDLIKVPLPLLDVLSTYGL
jgi:hypothetical protein